LAQVKQVVNSRHALTQINLQVRVTIVHGKWGTGPRGSRRQSVTLSRGVTAVRHIVNAPAWHGRRQIDALRTVASRLDHFHGPLQRRSAGIYFIFHAKYYV
jgi:hypothetical protein